jgi:hypothetical protein
MGCDESSDGGESPAALFVSHSFAMVVDILDRYLIIVILQSSFVSFNGLVQDRHLATKVVQDSRNGGGVCVDLLGARAGYRDR